MSGISINQLTKCLLSTYSGLYDNQKIMYLAQVRLYSKIHALSTYPSGHRGQRRDCVKLLKAYINRSKSSLIYILNTSWN